jgi:hypothetical protein
MGPVIACTAKGEMTMERAAATVSQLAAVVEGGVEKFLASSLDQPFPGNDHVTIDWTIEWVAPNRLSAVGNIAGKTSADVINLLVKAFMSPDYQPGTGRYYGGDLTAVSNGTMPGGMLWGFVFQSQQFTPQDYGKTIKVGIQGWVNMQLFGFERLFVIPRG